MLNDDKPCWGFIFLLRLQQCVLHGAGTLKYLQIVVGLQMCIKKDSVGLAHKLWACHVFTDVYSLGDLAYHPRRRWRPHTLRGKAKA